MKALLVLSFLSTTFSHTGASPRVEYWSSWTPNELQKEGMKHATAYRYGDAVPWFHRALKAEPTWISQWNNIGVTHMRMGEFDLARDAFIRCAVLERRHTDCEANRAELDTFLLERMKKTPEEVTAMTGKSRYAMDTPFFHAIAAELTKNYERDVAFWEKHVPPTQEQLEGTVPWPDPSSSSSGQQQQGTVDSGEDEEGDKGASPPIREPKQQKQPQQQHPRKALPLEALKHKVEKLPRIPISLLYHQNNSAYARGLKPFILTGIAEQPEWQAKTNSAFELWGDASDPTNNDLSFFSSFVSTRSTPAADYYPSNMRFVGVKPLIVPFKDAIQEMRQPSGRFPSEDDGTKGATGNGGGGGRVLQWNVNSGDWRRLLRFLGPLPSLFTSDELWLESPHCLGSAWAKDGTYERPQGSGFFPARQPEALRSEFFQQTHWRMILIGSEGGGMFFHADILGAPSWQIQVSGKKSWVICDPFLPVESGDDGNEGEGEGEAGMTQERLLYSAGDIDPFNPDYDAFPLFKKARCYHDTVVRGEALFYPSSWWHATMNEENFSIAISGSIVDQNSWRTVKKELGSELDGTSRRIRAPSAEYRTAMEKGCFRFWEDELYGAWAGL